MQCEARGWHVVCVRDVAIGFSMCSSAAAIFSSHGPLAAGKQCRAILTMCLCPGSEDVAAVGAEFHFVPLSLSLSLKFICYYCFDDMICSKTDACSCLVVLVVRCQVPGRCNLHVYERAAQRGLDQAGDASSMQPLHAVQLLQPARSKQTTSSYPYSLRAYLLGMC